VATSPPNTKNESAIFLNFIRGFLLLENVV